MPEGVTPVRGFDLDRYLGTWYEIARLDHRFERGLTNVTATYTVRDKGGISVLNRGYRPDEREWDQAEGKAFLVAGASVGRLKVSFFGPFYGGYNVVALDEDEYRYAMIAGPSRKYLWILARTPVLDDDTVNALVTNAAELGFATNELIFVRHDQLVRE